MTRPCLIPSIVAINGKTISAGLFGGGVYANGTAKSCALAFSRGTHERENMSRSVTAAKDYKQLLVSFFYIRPAGMAWFDDITLQVTAP